MFTIGILGLPNVGKSTLFNSLTSSYAQVANYPFTTIESNKKIVSVYDQKLKNMAKILNLSKQISPGFTFIDVAGLVKGASQGEGLGNKFLEEIQKVDAICHVVRCFEDDNVLHVFNQVNPLEDIKTINLELIYKDIEIVTNCLAKISRKAKVNSDEQLKKLTLFYQRLLTHLEQEKLLCHLNLNEQELKIVKSINLISVKPVIYIANVSSKDKNILANNAKYLTFKNYAQKHNLVFFPLVAKKSSKDNYLLVKKVYDLLGLKTFYTFNDKEIRAWAFKKNSLAWECAKMVHSDFAKGFIKVEIINYKDFVIYKNRQNARAHGKAFIEGKNYLFKDGDVALFKFRS